MRRNFGLDVVRAVSIWMVLIYHAGYNIPGLAPLSLGTIGVEVFFVLSGFLIGGIIFRDIDKELPVWPTLKSFWIRRWFRILPLYYLMILFKFVFLDSSIGWNVLYYVFFLQNNFYGISYYGVTWSLVIEEWFYLFSPVFLIFTVRYLKSERSILWALFAFILMINLARMVFVGYSNALYEAVNGNFPFRFDALFVGVVFAFLKHRGSSWYVKAESPFVFLIGLVGLIAYVGLYRTWSYPLNQINEMWFPRTLGFFILPFTISLMIPFMATIRRIDRVGIVNKIWEFWVTRTSLYTYAIYLTHMFFYTWVRKFDDLIDHNFLQTLLAIGMTYLVSHFLYRYFERPILDYRDRKVMGL